MLSPVLYVVGLLLSITGLAMAVPALVDVASHNYDWEVFAVSAGVTAVVGVNLALANRQPTPRLSIQQTFLLTVLSWGCVSLFAALPFAFSRYEFSYTDAVFEAVSGLTTTGSTVMVGLDTAPPGILLWRGILQWIGGIGIIVFAIAVLPVLRIGGMQLYRTESSDTSEKVLPHMREIATAITGIYVGLTVATAIAYGLAGMTTFEAVVHAMTTVSTGGYSTSDASLAHFHNPAIEWIAVVAMLAGGLPFVLYVQALRGRPSALWRDFQVRSFVAVLAAAILVMAAWLLWSSDLPFATALRLAAFQVTSIVTTTGYSTADYGLWGGFAVVVVFFLTFVGGCTGSTAGAMKIFRLRVLLAVAKAQIRREIHPHRVVLVVIGDRPLKPEIWISVLAFSGIYAVSVTFLGIALAATGLDLVTSISSAATAIGNVGPGLGPLVGPTGNFAALSDTAKWLLALGMLAGRLELLTVFVLFTPHFWRA